MFQAVRGVVVTPHAICMVRRGWQWDVQQSRWAEPRDYSLPEEAERVIGTAADGADDDDEDVDQTTDGAGSSSSVSRRRVVDTYYYDQLRVAPTASQREIRKAYFQQSRAWHPDKTTEANAKERFQAISEAYQVLSDSTRRRAYDSQGREGVGEGFVDAAVFFSVLLGADQLTPYVGRLRIAEMFGEDLFNVNTQGEEERSEDADLQRHLREAEQSEGRQVRRQVRLAMRLADRLECFGQGADSEAFCEGARAEARRISRRIGDG
jgi:DnaJ-domain-containing protein 1